MAAVPFALYPGDVNQDILDYSQSEASKYFVRATKPVNSDELFDASPENLHGFIKDVEAHAQKYGWTTAHNGIFWIPADINAPDDADGMKNLLTSYGEITIEHLTEWEETYLGQECREAQDSVQAYHSLRASLTKTALDKVNIFASEYTLDGVPSGPLFFKIIIRETVLDTNATALSLRTQLGSGSLCEYIEAVSYDISKFNQHVLMLIEALTARGERTTDLLANLFIAYATVKDEEFRTYVVNRRSEYEDGTTTFTHQQLMVICSNKFKNLVQAKRWSHESYEDKFLALQAKQEKTNKAFEKLKRKREGDGKKGKNGGKGSSGAPRNGKGGKGGGTDHKKELPGWMSIEPSADKLKEPRVWNDKEWHWCSTKTGGKCNPGMYRRHKPSACKGSAKSNSGKNSNRGASGKKLKVAAALANAEESDEEDYDE